MEITKNTIIQLEISDITSDGNGVGRYDNTIVFVPMTAIGDVIDCRIVKVLKSYCFGIIENIITPSADRVASDCEVFSKCGGCVFKHISYDAELKVKEKSVSDAFKRIGKIDAPILNIIPCNNRNYYRNKAQYPVGIDKNGKAICGFYAKRSHRIVPYTKCLLQPELFGNIVDTIMEYVNEYNVPPYDETSHKGELRHIYLRQGYHTKEVMVCLVCRSNVSKKFKPLIEVLSKRYPQITSVILNVNSKPTNVILGSTNYTLFGKDHITDTMCGNSVDLSPMAFYQVNTAQAEVLYSIAKEFAEVSKDTTLLDLYCGTGTIGLSMAKDVKRLIGVDIVPQSIENAKANAKQNDILNAEFYCGDAGTIASKLVESGLAPDVITIDPARKGCDSLAIDSIVKMNPNRIVMISCNPATASRDCATFETLGYTVKKVQPVDMFANTGHVECVVLLSKTEK